MLTLKCEVACRHETLRRVVTVVRTLLRELWTDAAPEQGLAAMIGFLEELRAVAEAEAGARAPGTVEWVVLDEEAAVCRLMIERFEKARLDARALASDRL